MKFSFSCSANLGEGIANVIRQDIVESSQAVKAVAYRLSEGNSLVTSSDDIVDVIQFASKLSKLTIEASPHVTFPLPVDYTFNGMLHSRDLNNSDITVKEDIPLLQCLKDKDVRITVVYNTGSGLMTPEAIKSSANISNDFTVLCVRHSNYKVGFSVSQDISGDTVTMNVTSPNADCSKQVIRSIDTVIAKLEEIKHNL